MVLSFSDARAAVLAEIGRIRAASPRAAEEVALDDALGRLLAQDARADRDQPPFPRVTRDGFAVRAADVAGARAASVPLAVIGEVPAGSAFAGQVGPGMAVEIMTGAPLPAGADAVVMVEHTEPGGPGQVRVARAVSSGENVVPRGSELAAGSVACPAGTPLDPASIALLASIGVARPRVFVRPRVAIVTTGDELVPVEATPAPAQIRNSNLHALIAQVRRAGATPVPLGIVGDDPPALQAALAAAFAQADLVLVSGGVSMGKHDHVEAVLAALGARVVFDGVAIRPGKPLVFGAVGDKAFFGLPGNPLSTLVTFELFVRPALQGLAGGALEAPPPLAARLATAHTQRALPLTVFLPARLGTDAAFPETAVRPLSSQGSGDLAAMAKADALVVLPPGTEAVPAGAWVSVVAK